MNLSKIKRTFGYGLLFFLYVAVFTPSLANAADVPFCLCEWKATSAPNDIKYSCVSIVNGAVDQEGSPFNFLDKAFIVISSDSPDLCGDITTFITKGKVAVQSITCAAHATKAACSTERTKKIQAGGDTKKVCFCSSADGFTNAKCAPDDGQSCKSYQTGEYTSCATETENSCTQKVAAAAQKDAQTPKGKKDTAASTGFVKNQQWLDTEQGASSAFNKIGTTNPSQFIGRLISAAMGILGSIALVMFIYGGILWMTAGGNEEHVTKARQILVWGSLGLAVIFASYAILKLVFGAFS